jgi:hypothetical protein
MDRVYILFVLYSISFLHFSLLEFLLDLKIPFLDFNIFLVTLFLYCHQMHTKIISNMMHNLVVYIFINCFKDGVHM